MNRHLPLESMRGGWTRPVVIYGLAVLVIPVGVLCDFYYAFHGELGMAAVWMMITLGSIGLLALYVRLIHLRQQVRSQRKSLDQIQREVDSLRAEVDSHRADAEWGVEQANKDSVAPSVAPELIAGQLPTSSVFGQSDAPPLKLVPGDEPPIPGADDETAARTTETPNIAGLRREFAQRVRDENFEAALSVGEEMVAEFPHSTSAREFQSLRPHLRQRADLPNSNRQPLSPLPEELPHSGSAQPNAQAEPVRS